MTAVKGSDGESSTLAGTPPAGAETASPQAESRNQPDVVAYDNILSTLGRRSIAQPPPNLITRLVSALRTAIFEPTPHPWQLKILPTSMPTSIGTLTATPTTILSPTITPPSTQTPTAVPIAAVNSAPGAIPVVYPTSGAIPSANPTFSTIPVIYPTPGPPLPPTVTLAPSPAISPTATLTPLPEYDSLLAEFYNSPTTNSFLMIYAAIVDPKEIPIGDMKIVGTRLDHNLTYESPVSTWHYEGYSAPGEVIKSGNVKFEPPGGIETTSWLLHLEDAQGNRQSEDVSFLVVDDTSLIVDMIRDNQAEIISPTNWPVALGHPPGLRKYG